jgi:hypothetical protein
MSANPSGGFNFAEYKSKILVRKGKSLDEIPLRLNGQVTEYYQSGEKQSESVYKDNQLVSNKYWRDDGTMIAENVFFNVDKPATYPLGDQYIKEYIILKIGEEQLPVTEIQDELLIGWVVTSEGKIGNVIILQGKVESVNDFFLRTISSLPGEWEPAVLAGNEVNYFITMPVNFTNAVPTLQNFGYSGGMIMWQY